MYHLSEPNRHLMEWNLINVSRTRTDTEFYERGPAILSIRAITICTRTELSVSLAR